MENKEILIFTYGTLRKGYSNHGFIRGSKFIANAKTGMGYRKVINGLPYLIRDPKGDGCNGEVYSVSKKTLSILDMLEGHPDWYVRTKIKVFDENNNTIEVWAYLMPEERI